MNSKCLPRYWYSLMDMRFNDIIKEPSYARIKDISYYRSKKHIFDSLKLVTDYENVRTMFAKGVD